MQELIGPRLVTSSQQNCLGVFFLIRGVHSGVYSGRYEELLRRRRLRRPSATTTATATINNERQQGKRTKTDKDMI